MISLKQSKPILAQSWRALRASPTLLVLPCMSGLGIWMCVWLFAMSVIKRGEEDAASTGQREFATNQHAGVLELHFVLTCFALSFVITFFNVALIAGADRAMRRQRGAVIRGLWVALRRLPQVIAWSIVGTVIELLLHRGSTRYSIISRTLHALIGTSWNMATYLVMPVLAVEGVGPITALHRSADLLSRTWGESLTVMVGFGLVVPVCILISVALMIAGAWVGLEMQSAAIGWPIAMVGATLLPLCLVVTSALRGVLRLALYRRAIDGAAPAGFDTAAILYHAGHAASGMRG